MTHKSNVSLSRASCLTSAIGMVLATAAMSAQAADTPSRLSTIRVEEGLLPEASSSKFTSPLSETPQTVAVVPKEIFNQQGAQNLTDVLFNTPGITFNAGENGFASGMNNFSMRGFDTSGSVFVDGVRDSGNYSRDVFNLEQVEIVKGPSGDTGRSAASGYVNLVTKTPHLGDSLGVSASVGLDEYDGDEYYRAAFDGNHAFTDSTALRLNLMVQDGGVPGREYAEQSAWGFAPSLAFGLGSDTRLILAYQHTESDDVPDWGVPGSFIDGMVNYDPALDGEQLRDTFFGLANDYDEVRADSARAVIEHDFASGLSVSNQLRWGKTERTAAYTLPANYDAATQTATTQLQGYWRDNKSLSNLTDFSFSAGAHTLAFGLELSREESTARRFGTETNPGGAAVSVFGPDAHRASARGVLVPEQESEVRIDTIAGYLYDTIALSEQWDLTGGVRVEKYEVEIDSREIDGSSQGPDGYELSKTTVSGKLGVVYKPRDNASIYASAGVAALPPGSFLSNPDISRTGNNAFPGWSSGMNAEDSKTQRSINYEIGTKWDFANQRLSTTAAVFRTERRNVAITGVAPDVTPAPAVARLGYGKQIVQGVELGLSGQINPAWSIFGGLAYMDSERDHSAYLDEGRRLASPNDYGTYTRTRGNELAFTPEFSGNVWTTYRFDSGLTLGGGLRYVGSSFLGRPDDAERIIPNGQFGELPSYTVADVVVTYDFNDALALRLNARNITDELYAVSSNWNGRRVTLGEPRSFLLSADYRF